MDSSHDTVFATRHDQLGRRGVLSVWMERQRIKIALPHLVPPVLDVGCGARAPLASFFSSGQYYGIDIKENSVTNARRQYAHHHFNLAANIDEIPAVQSVACLAVLEHVKDHQTFLAALNEKLLQNGTLVLTTPQPRSEFLHSVGARIGLFSRKANEDHEKLLARNALIQAVDQAGFKVVHYETFMLHMNHFLVAQKFPLCNKEASEFGLLQPDSVTFIPTYLFLASQLS